MDTVEDGRKWAALGEDIREDNELTGYLMRENEVHWFRFAGCLTRIVARAADTVLVLVLVL